MFKNRQSGDIKLCGKQINFFVVQFRRRKIFNFRCFESAAKFRWKCWKNCIYYGKMSGEAARKTTTRARSSNKIFLWSCCSRILWYLDTVSQKGWRREFLSIVNFFTSLTKRRVEFDNTLNVKVSRHSTLDGKKKFFFPSRFYFTRKEKKNFQRLFNKNQKWNEAIIEIVSNVQLDSILPTRGGIVKRNACECEGHVRKIDWIYDEVASEKKIHRFIDIDKIYVWHQIWIQLRCE